MSSYGVSIVPTPVVPSRTVPSAGTVSVFAPPLGLCETPDIMALPSPPLVPSFPTQTPTVSPCYPSLSPADSWASTGYPLPPVGVLSFFITGITSFPLRDTITMLHKALMYSPRYGPLAPFPIYYGSGPPFPLSLVSPMGSNLPSISFSLFVAATPPYLCA